MQLPSISKVYQQPLALITLVCTALLCLPLIVIMSSMFSGSFEIWQHLAQTVLSDYIVNSLWLSIGVGISVLLLGVPAAWLTSSYDFIGKKFFSWALLLPLAVPAYIVAYTYTGLLDFSGPVQTSIREWIGIDISQFWIFNVRSLGGAIVMMSLVLYPYVYLLARTAFLEQSASIIEAGRSLGYSYRQTLIKLVIPMARPAIIAGMTLALMETLADYGTVQFFGINTFTTGIFRAYYSFGDTAAAAQLATVLLSFVVLLIFLERYSRRKIQYHSTKNKHTAIKKLVGIKAGIAFIACFIPLFFGFLLPAGILIYWSIFKAIPDDSFLQLAWNSFYLAFLAALIATFVALIFAYSKRLYNRNKSIATATNLASTGYALPGTIIAIGILIAFSWLDHQLINLAEKWFDANLGLVFSGTIIAVLFAYTVRFMAVSFGAVNSGLLKIKPSLDQAAQSLGKRPSGVLKHIHIPLLLSPILTAMLIVFVDVLKELPATLILRPFNFNTLSIRAFELASDERLIDAAPSSLLIVLVGIIPVIILSKSIQTASRKTIARD